jgi:FixJ family two-component response regulator
MPDDKLIYVVDDDPAVLDSVDALLSQYGYRVECFADPQQFLVNADLHVSGCLICDVQMPGVSGAEVIHRLRSAESPLAVIIVTGVADVPMAVSLMESGAITLLEKPYRKDDLLRAVERAIARSQEQWKRFQDRESFQQRLNSLTEGERSVMKLMLSGEPSKVISTRLDMSMRTIDRRRHSVLQKMQVHSIAELAALLGRNWSGGDPSPLSASN